MADHQTLSTGGLSAAMTRVEAIEREALEAGDVAGVRQAQVAHAVLCELYHVNVRLDRWRALGEAGRLDRLEGLVVRWRVLVAAQVVTWGLLAWHAMG